MQDKDYLNRAIELAKKGGKAVRPNPLVGAVVVFDNEIIGEGYHKKFGGPHAEVNAINNVSPENQKHLSQSTIYVSLEPCCHYGSTPPCTDLIIKKQIPRVVIAELDPTEKVRNKGIKRLKDHGIDVKVINIKSRITSEFKANHLQKRPFIQLKFAKSKDNFIGQHDKQVWLSNEMSSIYTHKLRAYTDAILVGTNTALTDNPSLTLRNYPGDAPLRVVLDRTGKIPLTHLLLSDENKTLIFTENTRDLNDSRKTQVELDFSHADFITHMLNKLLSLGIHHLMVEGGASLLKSFVKAGTWDEAVIINTEKVLNEGIKAPHINGELVSTFSVDTNQISIVAKTSNLG